MMDYDSLDEFRDPVTYDLIDAGYEDDRPLVEQWARKLGGPLLDLACGTGRLAIPLAAQGYAVTGVDITPEMIAHARKKAATQGVPIEWVVADGRAFHLGKQFSFIYMVENAFQFFYTRVDHEALLACVREHLRPDGYFLFETRNPSPRSLYAAQRAEPRRFSPAGGGQLVITEERPRYDPLTQIQHREYTYRWTLPTGEQANETKRVALRFVFPQELEALLHFNGFTLREWYGTWQQDPLAPDSPEIIALCQLNARHA